MFEVPRVYYGNRLKLGKRVHINDGIFINAVGNVSIGDYCVLSHGVSIFSTGLDTSKWRERKGDEDVHLTKPIVINDNVWLGANVVVCAGVTIEKNSIVAAGAVVTSDLLEEGCLYGGVPARKIKELGK